MGPPSYMRFVVDQNVVMRRLPVFWSTASVAYRGGGVYGVQPPPPEIPKALQNRAKLNTIVKSVKNEFRTPTPQDVRKQGSKILNYLGSQLFYISNDI